MRRPTGREALRDAVGDLVQPRTDFERALVDWVVRDDEYRLAHRRFEPDDVVIDVGAHIGVFTAYVHHLGSRAIHAFEPQAAPLARLRRLESVLGGVTVDGRAVVRSDDPPPSVPLSAGIHANTGSVSAMFGGRAFDVDTQTLVSERSEARAEAPTVALDDVLRSHDRVALLKLDCEGMEFPILLTSTELGRVREIVGEYHSVSPELYPELDASARVGTMVDYRPEWLAVRLQALGFEVALRPHNRWIGWFHAVRR